ncbi:palmitoyltransferase akr1, partial [Dipsacomyces acuminosporus]
MSLPNGTGAQSPASKDAGQSAANGHSIDEGRAAERLLPTAEASNKSNSDRSNSSSSTHKKGKGKGTARKSSNALPASNRLPKKDAPQAVLNTQEATGTIEQAASAPTPAPAVDNTFWEAAQTDSLDAVRECVEVRGMVPEQADEGGNTALHWAAQTGSMKVLRYLIEERNANVNARSKGFSAPPLFWAISQGRLDVVMYLLSHGANASLSDSNGNTALHVAVQSGSVSLVIFIASTQFEALAGTVDPVDVGGLTPLMWAVYQEKIDIAEILIRAGAAVNFQDKTGKTPLHFALMRSRSDMVDLLLEKGADVNLREFGSGDESSPAGQSPREIAVSYGFVADFDKQIKRVAMQKAVDDPGQLVLG